MEIQETISRHLLTPSGGQPDEDQVASTIKLPSFQQSCRRRAEKFCAPTGSEAVTLKRVHVTWQELQEWVLEGMDEIYVDENASARIRALSTPQIEMFVVNATAPTRVHSSLVWIANNLHVLIDTQIKAVQPIKSQAVDPLGATANQKAAAELIMISELETQIVDYLHERAPDVLGLVGQWIQCVGGVRLKHAKLAYPVELSGSLLSCWCVQGKQKGRREGFPFAVPAYFVSRPEYNWAQRILKIFGQRPGKHGTASMVFNLVDGGVLSNQACIDSSRVALSDVVENVFDLSSKSWRRAGSTALLACVGESSFNAPEKLGYGDWQDRTAAGEEGLKQMIALRYADNRIHFAQKVKLSLYLVLRQIIGCKKWVDVPEELWSTVRTTEFYKHNMHSMLEQHKRVVWSLAEADKPTPYKERGFTIKGRGSTSPAPGPMPSIPGILLLRETRDNHLLCPNYQVGACEFSATDCPFLHQCAVSLRGGRACGMFNHNALNCVARKKFKATTVQQGPLPETLQAAHAKRVAEAHPDAPPSKKAKKVPAATKPAKDEDAEDDAGSPTAAGSGGAQPPAAKEEPDTYAFQSLRPHHWGSIFDELAQQRFNSPGHSGEPEPPRLIARLQPSGGVFLAGTPTRQTQEQFLKHEPTVQVYCFRQKPQNRRSPGVHLAGTLLQRCNMDDKSDAEDEILLAFRLIAQATMAGEASILHCAAGIHRAATVGIAIRATLHGESIEDARQAIEAVRCTEIHKAYTRFSKGNWDMRTWLPAMIAKLRQEWEVIQRDHGGVLKLAVANEKEGTLIHAVRVPHQFASVNAGVQPVCKYNQANQNPKSFFGEQSLATVHWGIKAVHEADGWSITRGLQSICKTCRRKLSPGCIAALEGSTIT